MRTCIKPLKRGTSKRFLRIYLYKCCLDADAGMKPVNAGGTGGRED
jgi:hypothetical protein